MVAAFLFIAVVFVAYSNAANDNFKGVASLVGSRTCSYRVATIWAAITTASGSIAAIFLAQSLLHKFSGKGLVSDALAAQPQFLLAVAVATGVTVILATLLGFPISTTHALTGSLVGAGLITGIASVNFAALRSSFITPLILSPILAVVVSTIIYGILHGARSSLGLSKEMCVCVGNEPQVVAAPQMNSAASAQATSAITVTADQPAGCQQRYTGSFLGVQVATVIDSLHFLSAGAVCFARGLNDTPKIAALLLATAALHIQFAMVGLAIAMILGGLLSAKKVAETMANKITEMNAGQGLSANLATAFLVNTASYHGLPVSTTHVSVGSLLGIGILTQQAKWKPIIGILLSWVITLPCAAILAALAYSVFRLI
jgi:PiT family inorganic phosphate transporter